MRKNVITPVVWALLASIPLFALSAVEPPVARAAEGVVSSSGSASTAGNRLNHTVRVPSTTGAGDRLVLVLVTGSTAGTVATPQGWTPVAQGNANGTGIRGRVFTKTATASDPGSNVTVSTSQRMKSVVSISGYRSSIGSAEIAAVAAGIANSGTASHPTPSVNVADPGSWVVSFWSEKSQGTATWAIPSTVVERSQARGTGRGQISGVLADSNGPTATGPSASQVATTSANVSRSIRYSLVIRPGSGSDNLPPTAAFESTCTALTCAFDASESSDPDAADTLNYSWNFGDGQVASGVSPSHTYAESGTRTVTLTVSDGEASAEATRSVTVSALSAVPGHTDIVSSTARTDMPYIGDGEITDLEHIGNRVFVVGGFTSIQNQVPGNSTTYNQRFVASFNINTGLVDANFRPTFDGGVTEIEASPDGSKLFVVGRFNTVNGATKRKIASINPTTGATVAGFTANANSAATSVEVSNDTVYVGGQFSKVNSQDRVSLAAVDSVTGEVRTDFVNNLSGGIGVNGELTVQALKLTHDLSKLLVVHTGRKIANEDRYGVGLISTSSGQLLPWRTRLWDDNLQFVGGIQRVYAGDIAPDDSYFVVGSGSGGDRPPINDTVIAFSLTGGDFVEPLWVSRMFDSIYSVAASETAVYVGGHFAWNESPSAPDPWPGLDNQGYGTGQGLSGYGLGDAVVRREHVGAISPADGKALEFNPWSNSFEGNKAMLVLPQGVVTGGDGNQQGGSGTGRIAVYNFAPSGEAVQTEITNPIEGRVFVSGQEFEARGTARTSTGSVDRVQVEVRDTASGQYLQDDLTSWGGANTIITTLDAPNSQTTDWSLDLTIPTNRSMKIFAKAFASNGASDPTKATKRFETFSTADEAPRASFTAPSGVQTTTTFTVAGTATDDTGISSIGLTVRDADGPGTLQADGSVEPGPYTRRIEPDVPGGKSTTWSYELTVPYESRWKLIVRPIDTAGQSSLDEFVRTVTVDSSASAPTVRISQPVSMTPPTAASPVSLAPGQPITFAGTANDDERLKNVEIHLRNNTTGERMASDCSYGASVQAGYCRISPTNLGAASYNWSYTTPFDLTAGNYTFAVIATDNKDLTTSSANAGILTLNVQVPGDSPPRAQLDQTGTITGKQDLHLDLTGSASDDHGVASVRVALRDAETSRYLQPDGTMRAAVATLPAQLAVPNGTSTTWALSTDLPTEGDWRITVYGFDTAGQQNTSTTNTTARYVIFPGDQPPVVSSGLLSPSPGTVFNDGRIVTSGRVNDDRAIEAMQVAVVDTSGRYMSSTGTFTSTTASWRTAFLNSPGSPGSNFAYTSPVVPAGDYRLLLRGVDTHGFVTDPPVEIPVSVTHPPNDAPEAAFTASCTENICTFDARTSSDENTSSLTYSWNFGNGTGSGAVVNRTYTSANTYTVTLTARDEYGLTSTASSMVLIVEPSGNTAPTPVFNEPNCTGLSCNFSSVGSADPNAGDTFTRLWTFGDGTSSTAASPTKAFPQSGSYTVTLRVTDGWGKWSETSRTVSVTSP